MSHACPSASRQASSTGTPSKQMQHMTIPCCAARSENHPKLVIATSSRG